MFADLVACFTFECWPEFLWEELFVYKLLAYEEDSNKADVLNGRPVNLGISLGLGCNLCEYVSTPVNGSKSALGLVLYCRLNWSSPNVFAGAVASRFVGWV